MSESPPPAVASEGLKERLVTLSRLRRHQWPKGAHHAVVEGLGTQDRSVRMLALRLAPKDVYDSVARALMKRLDDQALDDGEAHAVIDAIEGMVSRAVAFDFDVPCNPGAASKRRFTAMLHRLRALFHDPNAAPSLRVRAMEAGARGQQEWAAGAARVAWNTDQPMWRRAAVRAAGRQAGAEVVIAEAAEDEDPLVRALAWTAAGERRWMALQGRCLGAALDTGLTGLERAAALGAVATLMPEGAHAALAAAEADFAGDLGLRAAWEEAVAELELELD